MKSKTPLTLVLFLSLLLLSVDVAYANPVSCATHATGPYCSYNGRVKTVYINEGNVILMYFDTTLDLSQPSSVGITGITDRSAAAYRLTSNPEFAKALYATLLSAQARGARIGMQMRGREGGYLRIDRIWLYED